MLSATRAFAKSWVAALLIGLLIISFAVFGVNDVFRGNVRDAVIAAGPRTVTSVEFRREFDNFRRGAEQQVGQPLTNEIIEENRLDVRVLEELATREAFGAALEKLGIRPSEQLFSRELRKIPAFFDPITGRFDRNLYERQLSESGLDPATFETMMRDEIGQTHLISALVNGLRAPYAYTAMGSMLDLQERQAAYFTIDPQDVEQPQPPTDEQLTAFMQENAAQLTQPEQRVLTVARFSPETVEVTAPISEKELQERFEFRRDTLSQPETRSLVQIPVPDQQTGQTVAQRLRQGESPQAVASDIGVEPVTYEDRPRTAIADRRVAEAAFGLGEGEVGGPVQGDLGLAVVKVTEVTPGQEVTLEQVRPQLEAEIRADMAAERVYQQTQAYEEARDSGSSLAEAAQKAGVEVRTIGPVTAQGVGPQGQPVEGVSQDLLATAFQLPAETESDLQEAGRNEFYAVRVDRVIPAALPPLDEVRPELTRAWMLREMVRRMQARAETFAARLREGESIEAVANAAGSSVNRVAGLTRATAGENTALSRDALGKIFEAKPGDVFTAENTRFGFVVGKVDAVKPAPVPQAAELAAETRPQLTLAMLREMGESARQAARDLVRVRIDVNRARAALGLDPIEAEPEPKT